MTLHKHINVPHHLLTPRTPQTLASRESVSRLLVYYFPHLQSWVVTASNDELMGVFEDVLYARLGESPMELSSNSTFRCGELL